MRPREFIARDLVLWREVGNMKDQREGNFTPNWEGRYQVTTVAEIGAYYLEDLKEKPLP